MRVESKVAAMNQQRNFDRIEIERELRQFLDQTIRTTSLALKYDLQAIAAREGEFPEFVVTFDGSDRELLLERQAELLLALEYIAHRWLHLDPRLHDHVRFDCGDFRAVRLEELKLSARVAAQRVRETGQPFRFNPMPARERRMIHLELNSAADVKTSSEGTGERRQVVIYPTSSRK
jgi:spoIIIJ-associated protein